jgi:prophage DNA circulation protein
MAKAESNITAAEHTIEGFAEDLGKMLGHARTKAEGWLSQRQAIVKTLTELRDETTKLLSQLGHDAVAAGRRGRKAVTGVATSPRRPGRPAGSKNAIIIVGGKTRRKMSAKARAAISAAQKKRWAKQRADAKN